MDGVVHSRTLSAVLIALSSAAGSAVYKVVFKKLMGCVTFSQAGLLRNCVLSVTRTCITSEELAMQQC